MSRIEILQAAARIFSEKGYEAASMQDIAQAVHLQKASLYHHFTGKQDILLALLDQALEMLIARLEEVQAQSLAPEARLRLAMDSYLATLTQYHDLAAVLLLEYRSLSGEARRQHIARRDHYEQLWRGLIGEGIAAGRFAPQDPALAVRALLGVMNWTITWYRPDGPLSPAAIAGHFADLFLNGLIAHPGDTPEFPTP